MRLLIAPEHIPAMVAAAMVAVVALLGTFTHIVSQATQQGAARYVPSAAGKSAIKTGPPRETASRRP